MEVVEWAEEEGEGGSGWVEEGAAWGAAGVLAVAAAGSGRGSRSAGGEAGVESVGEREEQGRLPGCRETAVEEGTKPGRRQWARPAGNWGAGWLPMGAGAAWGS